MPDRICTVPDCTEPHRARGYCKAHYMKARSAGEFTGPPPPRALTNGGPCKVVDCANRATVCGLCRKHDARNRRTGDPLGLRQKPVIQRRTNDRGYVSVHAPDHPLADASSRVYEHRRNLFDALAGRDADCNWCGRRLYWFPARGQQPLNVDHLDWDRQNNAAANLVPTCRSCNTSRMRVVRKGEAIHSARLRNEDVLEIRASLLSAAELAAMYGVGANQIYRVRNGIQWKHLLAEGTA